jgi:dTDP-4-amino-4,6-dideoxygalactose transaminase
MIPIARPSLVPDERAEALELIGTSLETGRLAEGSLVADFEERFAEFVGVPYAVATSSGTSAIQLALLGLGIGSGDEVITVPFTFFASASAVLHAGARPVFVDIRERDFTMDPDEVESRITSRTRAIQPVSLYGHPANLPALQEIADRHGLHLVEDACQAHGATIAGRPSGGWGSAGCFSLYATKNLTTAEGGVVTTSDARLADRIRRLRSHGARVRYHHEEVGYNARMTDIHAAIGLVGLSRLAERNRRRREIAARYDRELRGVRTPRTANGVTHAYHLYTLRVPERDRFMELLRSRGVDSGIYYPLPLHRQPALAELVDAGRTYPVTDRLTDEVLSIPVHPSLTDEEVTSVIEAVNATASELGGGAAPG